MSKWVPHECKSEVSQIDMSKWVPHKCKSEVSQIDMSKWVPHKCKSEDSQIDVFAFSELVTGVVRSVYEKTRVT
jgi:hypothetical protein